VRAKDKSALYIVGAVVLLVLLFGEEEQIARRKLSRGELVKLARDVGFPDADFAATIAMRESGGDPMAANDNPPRERSFGLWQINLLAHPQFSRENMLNPRRNAEAAFAISKHGTDWSAWSTAHPSELPAPKPSTPEPPADTDFEP
jgi:hypothetical protein